MLNYWQPPVTCQTLIVSQVRTDFSGAASAPPSLIFDREARQITAQARTSQTLLTLSKIEEYVRALPQFVNLPVGWNGRGAPPPSAEAVKHATAILRHIRFSTAIPERVGPSADGGVAFSYVGSGKNRAMLEVLNDESPYVLLYNTEGTVQVIEWPNQGYADVLSLLEAHLGGKELAPESF